MEILSNLQFCPFLYSFFGIATSLSGVKWSHERELLHLMRYSRRGWGFFRSICSLRNYCAIILLMTRERLRFILCRACRTNEQGNKCSRRINKLAILADCWNFRVISVSSTQPTLVIIMSYDASLASCRISRRKVNGIPLISSVLRIFI